MSLPAVEQARPAPLLFNEAVNFEKQAIYVAIPKTGSTSVRVQLRTPGRYVVPHPHLNILQIRDGLYVYFLRLALRKNGRFPTALDRVVSDGDVRRQAAETFGASFKFTTVRNPWARAVSLYFRREGSATREELTFAAFCDRLRYASDTCLHPTRHENQLDWIIDEQGACAVDYVMRLERLAEDLATVAELTNGRVALEALEENCNPASTSHSYRDMYDDASKARIAQVFEKDIDTFGYAF